MKYITATKAVENTEINVSYLINSLVKHGFLNAEKKLTEKGSKFGQTKPLRDGGTFTVWDETFLRFYINEHMVEHVPEEELSFEEPVAIEDVEIAPEEKMSGAKVQYQQKVWTLPEIIKHMEEMVVALKTLQGGKS